MAPILVAGGDPDPKPGDLPTFVFTAAANDLSDLTGMTGTQPTVEDGVLKFEGREALDGDLILGNRYLVISIMIPGTLPQSINPSSLGSGPAIPPAEMTTDL